MTTRRLAAILAADVVGYSRLIGADEAGTLSKLAALRREIFDPLMAENSGRVFKTTGDGLLAEFPSTVQALRCAIVVQERVRGGELQLRIGVHQGDVVVEGGDLLGDGVNVAARLEGLAEPGGICISGRVREDAAGKLSLEVEDLGEPELKNITQRHRVFRVRLSVAERPALPLPDKPSIAVLPFQNMSGDPEQEYFADGMVEEIITGLSRVRSFFVIARNSSFAYKGKSPDVRQVGRELGVRYVLEGSVRKAGNRVRITGQLVDATTAAHIWADRFDGAMEDVFELQDRVTISVVAAIEPKIRVAEVERAQRKPTESLQAYDLTLRASVDPVSLSRDSLEEAIGLLQRAVAIDPRYAMAHARLAMWRYVRVAQGWRLADKAELDEIVLLARKAVELGGDDPEVLALSAFLIGSPGRDTKFAVALVEKALTLNPNCIIALDMMGYLQNRLGNSDGAIEYFGRAGRLNPLEGSAMRNNALSIAHWTAGRYEEACVYAERALQGNPNFVPSLRRLAAGLGLLGRIEEAHGAMQRLLAIAPETTIARVRAYHEADGSGQILPQTLEGLRRAGLPE
jgi:adenylate cyclase